MGRGTPVIPGSLRSALLLGPAALLLAHSIRRDSRDESEKGRWFENLVRRVLLENPEYEVAEVHRWADWPERVGPRMAPSSRCGGSSQPYAIS